MGAMSIDVRSSPPYEGVAGAAAQRAQTAQGTATERARGTATQGHGPVGRREGRLAWADVGRVVAILTVIVIHVCSGLVHTEMRGSTVWRFGDLVNGFTRWPVAVFVMISGALLLHRNEPVRSFVRKRLIRVAVPLLLWSAIYEVYRVAWLGEHRDLHSVVVDVAHATPFFHLYFLFVILGLYVLTPFLRDALPHVPRRVTAATTGMVLAFAAVNQLATHSTDATGGGTATSYFVAYTGFYLLGYLLRDAVLSRRQTLLVAGGFVVVGLLHAVAVPLLWDLWGKTWSSYPASYFSLFSIANSVLVFLLLRQVRVHRPRVRKVATALSAASFGIYLVHPAILFTIRRWTLTYGDATISQVVVTIELTAVLSTLVVLLLRRTSAGRWLMP